MNTKEKILNSALNLFSKNGYNAVSVRHIAAEVGIKASSLYNHFESKNDILNELIKINIKYINDFLKTIKPENIINSDKPSDIDSLNICLLDIGLKIINFFFKNSTVIKFRKLLIIEQFNNSDLAEVYQKIFITDIVEYESKLFNYLMDENILSKKDPYILALEFYSPIFLLLHNKDEISNENYSYLKKHILSFKEIYCMKG